MKKYSENLDLVFNDYTQLSFEDTGDDYIKLFLNNEVVGLVEVWTDVENGKREYIIINCEIVYLDNIVNINE